MENNVPSVSNTTPMPPVITPMPQVPPSEPQGPISSPPPPKKSAKLMYGIFGGILLLIIIAFLLVFFLSQRNQKPANLSKDTPATPTPMMKKTMSSDAIMKVGEEEIFQEDMDRELAATSATDSPELRKLITEKLITDSVILQQGQKDGLIQLDETVFNGAKKDYDKRMKRILEVTETIKEKNTAYKGSIIAIWFRNNDWIGPKGLEESKKIAFDTISALQKRINNKEITMEQAGIEIGNNESLAEVDKAYKSNAYYTFDVQPGQQITISSEFDALLKKQNINDVSKVYLAKNVDIDPAKHYEALYYVGMITEKSSTTGPDFNTWLTTAKKSYAVSK